MANNPVNTNSFHQPSLAKITEINKQTQKPIS